MINQRRRAKPEAAEPAASVELFELAKLAGGLRINWHDPAKFFETRSDLVWRLRRAGAAGHGDGASAEWRRNVRLATAMRSPVEDPRGFESRWRASAEPPCGSIFAPSKLEFFSAKSRGQH
jgi:hypothetical protein